MRVARECGSDHGECVGVRRGGERRSEGEGCVVTLMAGGVPVMKKSKKSKK